MKYRKLTEDGDYSFGMNAQDYIDGSSAVAQMVRTKILLFYGEWWEDIGIGIPMFQSLIGQMNVDSIQTSATLLINERLKELSDLMTVDSIEVDVDRKVRSLSFVINITATNGESEMVEVRL